MDRAISLETRHIDLAFKRLAGAELGPSDKRAQKWCPVHNHAPKGARCGRHGRLLLVSDHRDRT